MPSRKRIAGWAVLFGAFLYGGYLIGHRATTVASGTFHTTPNHVHKGARTSSSAHSTSHSGSHHSPLATASTASGLQVGQFAPGFTLRSTTGRTVSLSQLRGHAVWLNFWATWCPWCRKEIPELEKVEQRYGKQVDIYGVAVQQPQPTVSQYMTKIHVNYPVLLDSQGSVAAIYGVNFYPTSVFIGPNGKILAVHQGPFLSQKGIDPYLHELLHS